MATPGADSTMPLVCRICARVNPAEARYCYHDGAVLDGHSGDSGPLAIGAQRFHSPFVFPSGKSCRSFDELVLTCEANWTEAREVLQQGYLEGFLGGLGRADLARAARQATQASDGDRGLDEFLSKLPASTRQSPQLLVKPLEINLGQLSRDRDHRVVLDLANQGMGLLFGSISCADCDWLSVAEGTTSTRKLFQLRSEVSLPIHVIGKCLRAGNKKLEGRLNIESNGGGATVIVRAEVPVIPYPEGVLAGARTPREIASKAKAAPKEAATLFEKGAVAAWYVQNGWTYPVQGPASSGVGAVQQFFEALGLVTPPKVEINKQNLSFSGAVGASLREEIKVQTVEKKHVFAHATSSAAWLKISKVSLEGRIARIVVSVPAVPAMPGERLQATVNVSANGNQSFSVAVALDVAGQASGRPRSTVPVYDMETASAEPVLVEPIEITAVDGRQPPPAAVPYVPSIADLYGSSAPVARVVQLPVEREEPTMVLPVDLDAPPPQRRPPASDIREVPKRNVTAGPVVAAEAPDSGEEEGPRKTGIWVHLLPLAFLLLCLLGTLGRDLARLATAGFGPGSTSNENLDPTRLIKVRYHEKEERITLGVGGVKPMGGVGPGNTRHAFWEPSMRFGLLMPNQPDPNPRRPGQLKRLTFEELGLTNNTVVKLDGAEWIFGERPFREENGRYLGDWPGHWVGKPDEQLPETPLSVEGRRSVWYYDDQKVEITQTVEIVRGSQSNLLDTCLVRYRIHNKDKRPHTVGLRFLLDTFIGSNDGVPFLIPGASALCETSLEFNEPAKIPDFIQARENSDPKNPGTIAQVGFKVSSKLEPPSRVTLGAWPNPELEKFDARCQQEKTMWDVPVLKIHMLNPGDSAVTIYWNPVSLGPNQDRQVGFSYGLGTVSGSEGAGKLNLTLGGSFMPRGEFTVTALVSNPAPGQKVTLKLPDDFELLAGQTPTLPVPPLQPGGASRDSPVTWKVRGAAREGKYTLKVESSTGESQTQPVTIKIRGIFGG
jgi:hypothetical protein